MVRFAAMVGIILAIAACKPRRAGADLSDTELDRSLLPERLGQRIESKELMRPGPGYALLAGEQHLIHQSRIKALRDSPFWDQTPLLGQVDGSYVLYDYEVSATLKGSRGSKQVRWSVPAVTSFAAPIQTLNLLVQMQSGFFTQQSNDAADGGAAYAAAAKKLTLASGVAGAPSLKLISIDLYQELPGKKSNGEATSGGEETSPSQGTSNQELLPPDALSAAPTQTMRHLPLYYLKNVAGNFGNALSLTYGSLFVLNDGGQTGGSGFGIWLGEPIMAEDLRQRFPRVLVLGLMAALEDREALRQIVKDLDAGETMVLAATTAKQSRAVPAFDQDGLVVGSFSEDSGLPAVASVADYARRSSVRPEKSPKVAAAKTPEPGQADQKAANGTWEFVQYASGSKWRFAVSYRRPPHSPNKITIRDIRIYRDNALYGSTLELQTLSAKHDVTWTFNGWSWHKLELRRTGDKTPVICHLKMEVYGYPFVGWDKTIEKEIVCP